MSAMASADNGVGMDTLLGVAMGCRRKANLKPKLKGSCRTLTPREKEDPAGGLDELMAVPRRSRWEPTLSVFPNQLRVGDRFTDAEGEWEVASRPVGFKQGHEVRARVRRPGAPGLRHGARIGAEALRDQAADFVELDALADRLQRRQSDDRASHPGGVRVLRVSVVDDEVRLVADDRLHVGELVFAAREGPVRRGAEHRHAASPGEPRDFGVQRARIQQHVYGIAARGALAGWRGEP